MTPLTSGAGLGLATGHHIAGTALRFVFFSFVFWRLVLVSLPMYISTMTMKYAHKSELYT